MKLIKASAAAVMAGVSVLGLSLAAPSETQAQASGTSTVPIDVWALRDVVNQVQVSPDGKHVLVHISPSREGDYLLQIYKTDDLSKPFRTLAADPMEIQSATWVSSNLIYGRAWQQRRENVKRQEQSTYDNASYFYNLETNKFQQVRGRFSIANMLPDEPDTILISTGLSVDGGPGNDPASAFRPASYFRLNLNTGARELVLRGTRKYRTVTFDHKGNPRLTSGFENGIFKSYYRMPGEGNWKQFGPELDTNKRENLYQLLGGFYGPKGFKHDDDNIAYIIDAPNGEDKASLWTFNFETGQLEDRLFQAEDADVMRVGFHSIPGNNKLAYAEYPGAKWERHWFDEQEQALYEALEAQIPYAHQVRITSRSYDGKTMVVNNSGPRDPGSFWLVKDGKLAKLGSRNPLLNQANLADVEFIRYPSRDGELMIPGYVTKPKGEGPFPLVVLPHGGPAVPEVVIFDEWAQLLAAAGYMVLQPGYRETIGWGKRHSDLAFNQHGYTMQDDKDDGALYLVEQGMVDPDRIAMFGWSYGGYAALVAASREDNIYQCAIAGAAVSRPEIWYNDIKRGIGSKAMDEWFQGRGVNKGINPYAEVSKVNIPLLMVHPEDDSRVLYYHFEDYKKAFEAAGKEGQFVTLEDADHFYVTLMYNHQQQFYTKMLDYLANDCGPGGL